MEKSPDDKPKMEFLEVVDRGYGRELLLLYSLITHWFYSW